MAVNLLRKRLTERHEHNRPVNGVEAHNVLADDVRVGRPVLFVLLRASVGVVADTGDIVRERINPNIHNVFGIEVNGNSPLKARARYAEILKSGLDKVVEHFLFAALGVNKVGILLDVFLELFLIL